MTVSGPVASLNTAWFALIGLLWAGYFVLEGFDFGVGVLSLVIGRDDTDRRMCLNAVGPFWDGNEVWLIVAAGATFAAFPVWYASMFSAFYLALFVVLAALIVRGVSFEFRGKRASARWRAGWDCALVIGSLIPAFAWGLLFTDLVHGLRLSGSGIYLGGWSGLLVPVAVLGGLASLALFIAHGAMFLALKTSGSLAGRARRAATPACLLAGALVVGLAGWLAAGGPPGMAGPHGAATPRNAVTSHPPVGRNVAAGLPSAAALPGGVPMALAVACAVLFAVAGWLILAGRTGVAFGLSALGILAVSAATFTALFPRVLVSTGPGPALTIWSAASAHLTLVVMSIVATIFVPFVLLYQGWSYWVFRQRLTRPPGQPGPASPAGTPGPVSAADRRG
jgi:cytochrome bd ubiquinol oxidase subunit II